MISSMWLFFFFIVTFFIALVVVFLLISTCIYTLWIQNVTINNANDKRKQQIQSKHRASISLKVKKMFAKYLVKEGAILKSLNDKKKYKLITLVNGLKALLISDTDSCLPTRSPSPTPSATSSEATQDDESDASDDGSSVGPTKEKKLCGAALSVRVGTLDDPTNIQGLAHLVEHVILMGNKSYPEENSFDVFLNRKSGYYNAHTDCETTIYEFQVPNRYFQESLQRFAAIFVSPLFRESSMMNEIRPVDNEFKNSVGDDDCRSESLLASLTKPDHDLGKFGYGNVKSLVEVPKTLGINLHHEVIKFWSTHYHASNMNLVVQGEYELETLEQWVTEYFSDIPRSDKIYQPSMTRVNDTDIFPYEESKFCKLFYVEPISSGDHFYINFWLPPKFNCYKSKPLLYLGSLLGHEGKGSLFSILKKKGYVLELIAGNHENGFDSNRFQALLTIQLKLTPLGLENLDSIVDYVWSYIDFIKTNELQRKLLEEDMAIRLYSFSFANEKSGCRNCVKIAENMCIYDTEHILTGSKILFEIDEDKIRSIFSYLVPSRANYLILSKKLFKKTKLPIESEKWFGTKYISKNVPDRWSKYLKPSDFDTEINFPFDNDFIANNFDLLPSESSDYPQCISETLKWRLWHKKGNKYEMPKVCVNLVFRNPMVRSNPQIVAALDLYIRALVMKAEEDVYPASLAGLNYYVILHDTGIVLTFNGFNDKISKFIKLIVHHLVSLDFDETTFSNIRRDLADEYYNSFNDTSTLVSSIRLSILKPNFWPPWIRRTFLPTLTKDIVISTGRQLLRNSFLECLIVGNVTSNEALSIIEQVSLEAAFAPLYQYSIVQDRINQLPPGNHICRLLSFNKEEKSSQITNYYQFEPIDVKAGVLGELLNSSMNEPLFDTLRTQEGLGYEVYNQTHQTHGVGGFTITVVSDADKFDCSYIDTRIEAFLTKFSDTLTQMEEEDFDEQVKGLIKVKSAPFLNLNEECKFFWNEILEQQYRFDRRQKEIAALTELNQSDFITWSYLHLLDAAHRKKLSIQIVANGSKALEESFAIQKNPFIPQRPELNVHSGAVDCKSVFEKENVSEIDKDFSKNHDCQHLLGRKKRSIDDEDDEVYILKHLGPKSIQSGTKLIVDIEEFKRYLPIYPKIRRTFSDGKS